MAKSLTVTAYVNSGGPIFDGRAPGILARFEADARQAIADRGVELLRAFRMDKTGRARGGFQENLHTVTRGTTVAIPGPMIQGVVWTPWLEGVSKRNQSTGFKGYHLFRSTRAQLDREAVSIADKRL